MTFPLGCVGCLLLVVHPAIFTQAQGSPQGIIKHIIVVIQENRTPDNLFHDDTTLIKRGANVVPPNTPKCLKTGGLQENRVPVPLTPWELDACFDPEHLHRDWVSMFDGGAMDGACNIPVSTQPGCKPSHCPPPYDKDPDMRCSQYTYVPNLLFDARHSILDPYFQIADQWGFANYFFQTNQGPSFPAHQFLFSGTSAPNPYQGKNYSWFVAENPIRLNSDNSEVTGCIAPDDEYASLIDVRGNEAQCKKHFDARFCKHTCYDHPTMVDVIKRYNRTSQKNITWRYYGNAPGDLWTAPTMMRNICKPTPSAHGMVCTGEDWINNVKIANRSDRAPILTDLGANANNPMCNLASVSWVAPDRHWSDHPGFDISEGAHDGGPSYVAAIVNAVGGFYNDGSPLATKCGYWDDTVVLVVWDDWGGFYDHVPPPRRGYQQGDTNGAQYVYGFRVPFLVVSKYAIPHYISGTDGQGGLVKPFIHDFGSILNFIEYALGRNHRSMGTIGDANFPYADAFVKDTDAQHPYSLSDFFNFSRPHPFVKITGSKYRTDCFNDPLGQGCFANYVPAGGDGEPGDAQDSENLDQQREGMVALPGIEPGFED